MSATSRGQSVEPVISIIIPAYNAADSLQSTIADILRQTGADFEVVLVDDGSTDATMDVAARLANTHPRVRFFRLPENRGVARAREYAVQHSRGEYLWFIDADDRPEPEALTRLVTAAQRTDADVVLCSAQFVDEGGGRRAISAPRLTASISGKEAFVLLLDGQITGHLWNKLFRRELANSIEFTPARVHSDLAMVAQLLAAADRVIAIPDMLYSYHLRSGSIIHSGTRRAESLVLVDDVVRRTAERLDPAILRSTEYGYFRFRFILLSGLKDAAIGPYDPGERRALVAQLRRRLGWRTLLLPLRGGDWRRLTLGVTAKLSMPLYRRTLQLASARAGAPTEGGTPP